jgi:ribosomal protein S18 acetylase RimI-like enzyme
VVGSPAIQFYRRLGFQITGTSETHHQMRWCPPRQ